MKDKEMSHKVNQVLLSSKFESPNTCLHVVLCITEASFEELSTFLNKYLHFFKVNNILGDLHTKTLTKL